MIKTKDNDMVVTYDPKTKMYSNSTNTIKIKNVYDARAYNKLLNEPTATPKQVNDMSKRIDNARAYSGAPKKEEGLFESIITNLGKDKKPQKAKLAREISQTIKPSNIDEYIKIRTEVAETSPSTVRIVQQEDPDMKQGIGALYKST
jgi:hypothetical protein